MQIIQGTEHSPEIIIDNDASFIAIRGVCVPEIGATLFDPIMSCVEELITSRQCINMVFDLKYFNSVSSHHLLKIFSKIASLLKGEKTQIEWKFDPEDDDNKTKGELFSELSGLDFKFVESK